MGSELRIYDKGHICTYSVIHEKRSHARIHMYSLHTHAEKRKRGDKAKINNVNKILGLIL